MEAADGFESLIKNLREYLHLMFFIMDEYTQKSYYAILSELNAYIKKHYNLIVEDDNSHRPVFVYQLAIGHLLK